MLRRIALLGLPTLCLGIVVWVAAYWRVTASEGQENGYATRNEHVVHQACLLSPSDDRSTVSPRNEYVTRKACQGCHDPFIDLWTGTGHDLAMDHATPQTVLGKFGPEKAPTTFQHFKTPFRMFRKGDSFYAKTIGADGKLDTFQVKYVFGAIKIQQYLVELPGGKVQALPIAWDVKGQRWYHLYPDEPLPPGDSLHWTNRLQNWNYMCAECHVTNFHKGYNAKNDTYHSTFGEIDVSCEACHGPCGTHVELAEKNLLEDPKADTGIPNPRDPKIELDSCAPCHARRQHIYPGFKPGCEFLDYYIPDMLDSENYHPDGQFLGEDYEYGSYVQSRMYHNEVRCRTCHSAKIKHKDHRLCAKCHDPKKYDTPEHHFHPEGSTGAECVNCHMPQKVYMGVDLRHDHSFRVPRPDLTVSLGIPNSCNDCHKDKKPQWTEEYVTKWYGKRKETVPHFAHAIHAGRKHLPEGEKKLLEVIRYKGDVRQRKGWPSYVRASALMLLADYPQPLSTVNEIVKNLKDKDPLVRYAAVHALEHGSPVTLNKDVAPMLDDPVRAVRVEAARILTPIKEIPLTEQQAAMFNEALKRAGSKVTVKDKALSDQYTKAFDKAIAEYRKGQDYLADQAAAHLNLAVIHEGLGEAEKALAEYKHAVRLDPTFIPARMNAALLLDKLGKTEQAEAELRKAIEAQPTYGEAYYSLGLLLAAKKEGLPEAAKMLAKAVELTPANARMRYNLGLAYQKLGKTKEAEAALSESCRLAPDPANLKALAILYVQTDRKEKAIETLKKIIEINPNDYETMRMIHYLSQPNPPKK